MIQFYFTKILNRWTIIITLPHIWSWSSNARHILVRYSHTRVREIYKGQFRYNVLIWFRTRWQRVWEHPPPSWLTHWWCFGRARRLCVTDTVSSPIYAFMCCETSKSCPILTSPHPRHSPDFHLTTAGGRNSSVQTTALLQEHIVTTLEKSADN